MSAEDIRAEVAAFARRMYEDGMVVGTAGNVSARIPGTDHIAITPSSLPYPELNPTDVQVLDLDGNQLTEGRPPSFERGVHLGVYRAREDVGAVFHTHATFCSVLAALRRPLPPVIEELVPYVGGAIEVADYAMSSTDELSANVVRALGDRNAVLLANHGNLCCGTNLQRAYKTAQLVERVARIYVLAQSIGQPVALPDDIVAAERQMFSTMQKWG